MSGPIPPLVLTEDAAAALLGVTVRLVRRWVRDGKIPGRLLPDGSAVVPAEALREWAEAGAEAGADDGGRA